MLKFSVIYLKEIPRKIIIRFWKNLGHFCNEKKKLKLINVGATFIPESRVPAVSQYSPN